jgi:signal peptidase I
MNDNYQINNDSTLKKSKSFFRELLETMIIVVVVLLPIRFYIAQPFVVVGSSMYPSFEDGDYLIVDEISYRFTPPKRGDVVVFRPPTNEKDHYIKRVVGLPGETVSVIGNEVKIINKENPQGFILEESYIYSERDASKEATLGENEYFVLGDNRAVSSDSRVWGPITKDELSGRVLLRLFPISSIGYLPGGLK